MRTGVRRGLAVAVTGLLFVAACGGDDDDADSPAADTATEAEDTAGAEPSADTATADSEPEATADETGGADTTVASDGESDVEYDLERPIHIVYQAQPGNWDPHLSTASHVDNTYLTQVYDSLLLMRGKTREVEPMLATEWGFDDAGTTFTMTLRDDVTFHDGGQLDAELAKANLERAKSSAGAASSALANVTAIEAPDATTLVLTLAAPQPGLPFVLATAAGMIVSPDGLAAADTLQTTPHGSGPYILESSTSTEAVFVRNDNYWNPDQPIAVRKTITGNTDPVFRLNGLKSGEFDVINVSVGQYKEMQALAESGEIQLYEEEIGQRFVLMLNNNTPGIDNPEIRKAINMAIDRETINQTVLNGACPASYQHIPNGFPGYLEGDEYTYPYDPEAAKALVDANGGPFTVKGLTPATEPNNTLGTIIQQQLAEIGITVEWDVLDGTAAFDGWVSGEYGMSPLSQLQTSPDAESNFRRNAVGPFNPGEHDPALVALVDEASKHALGSPERTEGFAAANQYVFDNAIWAPICAPKLLIAAKPGVVGLDDQPFSFASPSIDSRNIVFAAE